jgi:hypothetical protein
MTSSLFVPTIVAVKPKQQLCTGGVVASADWINISDANGRRSPAVTKVPAMTRIIAILSTGNITINPPLLIVESE